MALDLDSIVDNLYVGGMQATSNPSALHELGITHVVTVSDEPVAKIVKSGMFKYKFVKGIDMEDTDLLQHFPNTSAFIEEGVKSGATFVHCIAGVSRSVTLVIAYLMEKNGMHYLDALKLAQGKRKYANPNEGFMKQLELYQEMNCRLDPSNDKFRLYKLTHVALSHRHGDQDKDDLLSKGIFRDSPQGSENEIIYKCRKCRKPLFRKSGFMTHYVGPGEMAFDWRGSAMKKTDTESESEICERSIFIEPVEWMKDSIISSEGKLSCPKCNAKIGSYVWYGERCPCGAWVIPAFHIQTGKVDECKPLETVTRMPVVSTSKTDQLPEPNIPCEQSKDKLTSS